MVFKELFIKLVTLFKLIIENDIANKGVEVVGA